MAEQQKTKKQDRDWHKIVMRRMCWDFHSGLR